MAITVFYMAGRDSTIRVLRECSKMAVLQFAAKALGVYASIVRNWETDRATISKHIGTHGFHLSFFKSLFLTPYAESDGLTAEINTNGPGLLRNLVRPALGRCFNDGSQKLKLLWRRAGQPLEPVVDCIRMDSSNTL